jgi:glycosyltransferase involved in cell wall biosynthesis
MLCHRLGGPPFSMTVHGPEEFDRAAGIGLSQKIAAARFVVAISQFTRSQLFRHCPASMWDKIHVVHCGLDRQFLDAPATPLPEAPGLVCVGRLCEQKGQMLLLRAIAQLREEFPSLRLALAGDGPMRGELEAEIERLRLADAVRITGSIDAQRVQEEIQAARALVLPSFAEGLPVVLMEAMALGRPVVSTYVAGIPELVEHGRNGWLVPAGSVDRLVEALREVLAAPVEQLARMGQEGRRVVLERHDAAREAEKLGELFKGCGLPASATNRQPAGEEISTAPLRPAGQEL